MRSLSEKVMYWVSKYVAFFNALVAVSLVVARAYQATLPTIYLVIVSALATVVAFFDKQSRDFKERDLAKTTISRMLTSFLREFNDDLVTEWRLRIAVYTPDKPGRLSIKGHVNMEGDPDLTLTWERNQGFIGVCFEVRGPVFEDTSVFQGVTYEQVQTSEKDNQAPWGVTKKQWLAISNLGSILCVPIPHPVRVWQAVGVLVIDSSQPMHITGFDREPVVESWSRRLAPSLSELLCQAGYAKR